MYIWVVQFSRNNKISRLVQKELSEIFLNETKNHFRGLIITVTHVFLSKDLSSAKVYLSLFPTNKKKSFLEKINARKNIIKNNFCLKTQGRLKKTPELFFYLDSSIDHYKEVDALLK